MNRSASVQVVRVRTVQARAPVGGIVSPACAPRFHARGSGRASAPGPAGACEAPRPPLAVARERSGRADLGHSHGGLSPRASPGLLRTWGEITHSAGAQQERLRTQWEGKRHCAPAITPARRLGAGPSPNGERCPASPAARHAAGGTHFFPAAPRVLRWGRHDWDGGWGRGLGKAGEKYLRALMGPWFLLCSERLQEARPWAPSSIPRDSWDKWWNQAPRRLFKSHRLNKCSKKYLFLPSDPHPPNQILQIHPL